MDCVNFMNQEGIDKTVAEWEAKWGNPDNPPRPKGIMPCAGCIDTPNLRPHRCCFKPLEGATKREPDALAVQLEILSLLEEHRAEIA
ncbi:hypothetical protein ES707_01397 [subsurface metagenome]